jgi:YD repeat-containing protein
MLSQQGPAGFWKFRYDDNIGVAVFTEPSGNEVSYYYDGKQQLLAYGSSRKDMTLFNYDVTGRIFQVATGELLNEPSGNERPRFKVTKMVTPEIPNPEKPAGSG